jgi:hypothetical protein
MNDIITSLDDCYTPVSLKNATYLKSLGFKTECDYFYDKKSGKFCQTRHYYYEFKDDNIIWAPRISAVKDWLKQIFKIIITTNIHSDKEGKNLIYTLKVFEFKNSHWEEIKFNNTNYESHYNKLIKKFEDLIYDILSYLNKKYNRTLVKSLYFDLDLTSLQKVLNNAIEGKLSLCEDSTNKLSNITNISKNEIIKNLYVFDENFKALRFDFSDYAQIDFESDHFVFEFNEKSVYVTIQNTKNLLDFVLDIPYYLYASGLDIPYYLYAAGINNVHDELILHRLDFYNDNTIKPIFK